MFRILSVLLILTTALPAFSAELRDYDATRVAPNTWVIHGPLGDPSPENQGFMNNPAFVVTRGGVVVIDPGSSVQAGRMVLRQIRKVTDQPVTHVLNTHVHGDHWLGNHAIHDAYPNAKILAHPDMIRQANEGKAKEWLNLMDRLSGGFTRGTRAVIPTVPVTENQTVAIGGMRFRIYAPPKAHSGTDIMIEVIEESLVFLGDNVMSGRLGRADEAGSFRGGIAACDRALGIEAKVFVPGHGQTAGREIVSAYRNYLATLFEAAKQGYDTGKADYEMKDAIRAKLAAYAKWVGFDTNLGRHISVAVLEIESM